MTVLYTSHSPKWASLADGGCPHPVDTPYLAELILARQTVCILFASMDHVVFDDNIAITATERIDDLSDFDYDVSTDDVLAFDYAAPVIISNISKHHSNAIYERLYHLKEDSRAHDSLRDTSSPSHRSSRSLFQLQQHDESILLSLDECNTNRFSSQQQQQQLQQHDESVLLLLAECTKHRFSSQQQQPQQQLQQHDESILLLLDECTTYRFSSQQQQQQQQLQQQDESILPLLDECTTNRFSGPQQQQQQQRLQQHDESIIMLLEECIVNRLLSPQQQQHQRYDVI